MYLIFHHHQRHNDWPAQHSQKIDRNFFFAGFDVQKNDVKMRMKKKYFWWGLCCILYERYKNDLISNCEHFWYWCSLTFPSRTFFVPCLSQFHNKHMNNARTHDCRGFECFYRVKIVCFWVFCWLEIDNSKLVEVVELGVKV
jgi:hypothetical protein